MKKSAAIVYVNDTTAQVTKSFQKNAVIFGTEEFKLWREYLTYYPNAKMQTKSIKKNPNKKTTRNMTYANMAAFIMTQENSAELMTEYETIRKRSMIQKSPYQYVLAWFEAQFDGYNDLSQFMAAKEAERSAVVALAA